MRRILDANWNRAAEGARVVEDYARFVLNDPNLSHGYKHLRHDLSQRMKTLDDAMLIRCRDIPGDVGGAIATHSEGQRVDVHAVAAASQKRLEQALRCLEEYGKILDPPTAAALERLRYRAYQLGQAVMTCEVSRRRLASCRLYVLITPAALDEGLDAFEQRCRVWFQAGADVLQLRAKTLTDERLLALARRMTAAARSVDRLAVINDRPDVALASGAHGVHLGQDDLPIAAARRILGPHALIGRSTHDLQQARDAVLQGADYLGYGPTFASTTKSFAPEELAGPQFVRQASLEIGLPGFAIGGLTADNLGELLANTNVHGVAVSGAVAAAESPEEAITALQQLIQSKRPSPLEPDATSGPLPTES